MKRFRYGWYRWFYFGNKKNQYTNDQLITKILNYTNLDVYDFPVDIWSIAKKFNIKIYEVDFKISNLLCSLYGNDKNILGYQIKYILLSKDLSREIQNILLAYAFGFHLYYESYKLFLVKDDTLNNNETLEVSFNNIIDVYDKVADFALNLVMPKNNLMNLISIFPFKEDERKIVNSLILAFMVNKKNVLQRFDNCELIFDMPVLRKKIFKEKNWF